MESMVEIGPGCGSEESGNQSPPSYRDQDRFLPMANISRIMKKGVPQNGKIAKDSKELVQECVSEFVSFITSEASVKCQKEKRKTINGDDLLWAMSILGFEHYVYPLKIYLLKYRVIEGESKGSAKDMGGSASKNGDKGLAPESSYSQSLSYALYANSQAQSQYMAAPVQGME